MFESATGCVARRREMIAEEELLSFRQQFWPDRFPIEARYYQFGSFGPSCTLTTQRISSAQELHAFQDELNRRERAHEWSFIAYYEALDS
jgi:hypothetical protein